MQLPSALISLVLAMAIPLASANPLATGTDTQLQPAAPAPSYPEFNHKSRFAKVKRDVATEIKAASESPPSSTTSPEIPGSIAARSPGAAASRGIRNIARRRQ